MSRDHGTASSPRCLLVWLTVTLAVAAVAGVTLPGVPATWASRSGDGSPVPPFDRLLVGACEILLLLCAGWVWLVTGLVVRDAARGRPVRRRGVPDAVRRLVLAACGAALGGLLVHPAHADAPPAAADRQGPAVLHGLPLPDRATTAGHVSRLVVRKARAHAAAREPGPGRPVAVAPGDTLWGLARDSLPAGSSDAEIDRWWRSIYAHNRAVVGPDPDLLRPGQRLRLPPHPNRP